MPYPSRTETLDDLYTAIFNNRRSQVTDNIFTATPVYFLMKKRGGITFNGTGGRYLEVPLSYAKPRYN